LDWIWIKFFTTYILLFSTIHQHAYVIASVVENGVRLLPKGGENTDPVSQTHPVVLTKVNVNQIN